MYQLYVTCLVVCISIIQTINFVINVKSLLHRYYVVSSLRFVVMDIKLRLGDPPMACSMVSVYSINIYN